MGGCTRRNRGLKCRVLGCDRQAQIDDLGFPSSLIAFSSPLGMAAMGEKLGCGGAKLSRKKRCGSSCSEMSRKLRSQSWRDMRRCKRPPNFGRCNDASHWLRPQLFLALCRSYWRAACLRMVAIDSQSASRRHHAQADLLFARDIGLMALPNLYTP